MRAAILCLFFLGKGAGRFPRTKAPPLVIGGCRGGDYYFIIIMMYYYYY